MPVEELLNFYNDSDKKICLWIQELIKEGLVPDGIVDSRPIQELRGSDLEGEMI